MSNFNAEDECAFSIVRLGYAVDDSTDQFRCLNFRVGFGYGRSNVAAACFAVSIIDQYNDFDAVNVCHALNNMNLGPYTSIYIGREGSPVMYIGCRQTDVTKLTGLFRDARADEIDFNGRELRIWWD